MDEILGWVDDKSGKRDEREIDPEYPTSVDSIFPGRNALMDLACSLNRGQQEAVGRSAHSGAPKSN